MRLTLTKGRIVALHDIDGVHYPYHAFADILDFCGNIKALVAPQLLSSTYRLLPMTAERAKKIGRLSYRKTGDGLLFFTEIARRKGMDTDAFREEISTQYHRAQLDAVRLHYPEILQPCEETNRGFEALRPYIRRGAVSQSCQVEWIRPVLTSLQQIDFFEPNCLLGFREFGWQRKAVSPEALRLSMEILGVTADQCVFIEDNLDNLRTAKQWDGRLLTVFLSHNKPLKELPDFVDIESTNLCGFLAQAASVWATPKFKSVPTINSKGSAHDPHP